MAPFKEEDGDWVRFRSLPRNKEEDFHHFEKRDPSIISYEGAMDDVRERALAVLRSAQQERLLYVIFRHGESTSRPGKTTARSVVRGLMRCPEATPFICRSKCIQHPTVFVAAIRAT
jgi:hypothetical protein